MEPKGNDLPSKTPGKARARGWKATAGNLLQKDDLTGKCLSILWKYSMVNLFQVADRFPLEIMLIFYHIGWEFAQEPEFLRAAVAVASCRVNSHRASGS